MHWLAQQRADTAFAILKESINFFFLTIGVLILDSMVFTVTFELTVCIIESLVETAIKSEFLLLQEDGVIFVELIWSLLIQVWLFFCNTEIVESETSRMIVFEIFEDKESIFW